MKQAEPVRPPNGSQRHVGDEGRWVIKPHD